MTADELVRGVTIALGHVTVAQCRAVDADDSGDVTVSEIVRAVGQALDGC